jgi:hypothetical protein
LAGSHRHPTARAMPPEHACARLISSCCACQCRDCTVGVCSHPYALSGLWCTRILDC